MASLVARSGPASGQSFSLTKDLNILGRGLTVDVPLPDQLASREHAHVRRDGPFFTLIDLGSRNGTLVNGRKVIQRLLDFGDRVRVGEVELELVREPSDQTLADLLTGFELKERLGEGGMGIVFKAVQRSMGREVALKILAPKYAKRQPFVDQFLGEAKAAGSMAHPNLIQVHDVGSENGIYYFSMELIDGPTTLAMVREFGRLEQTEALEIVRQAAEALDYAHAQRLIHRDVKPDNLMVARGSLVKLADLGISRSIDDLAADLEQGKPSKVVGTPAYLAPEAAMGRLVDHRTDLYALGATFYHLLVGRPPFAGPTPAAMLKAQVVDPIPEVRAHAPTVLPPVADLCRRLLAKDPADRPQSAQAVREECERLLAHRDLAQAARLADGHIDLLARWQNRQDSPNRTTEDTPEALGELSLPTTSGGNGRVVGRRSTTRSHPRGKGAGRRLPVPGWLLLVGGIGVGLGIAALTLGGGGTATPAATTTGQRSSGDAIAPAQPVQAAPLAIVPTALTGPEIAGILQQVDRAVQQQQWEMVSTALAQLPTTGLPRDAQQRRDRAAKRVAEARRQRLTAALDAAGTAMRRHLDSNDFTAARAAIPTVGPEADRDLLARRDQLAEEFDRAKTKFLTTFAGEVSRAAARQDLAALSTLRKSLPSSLADTPEAFAVDQAIEQVVGGRERTGSEALLAVRRHLARWDLDDVQRVAKERGDEAFGTSAEGQLRQAVAAAGLLKNLPDRLGGKLTGIGKVRFNGSLGGATDPWLIGASASALQIEDRRGGRTELRWTTMAPGDLQAVARAVLGDEQALQNAIQALVDAREAAK